MEVLIKRVKDFAIKTYGGGEEDFYIHDIVEIRKEKKIFFFIRPSDFGLSKRLGIDYIILPGPIVYDTNMDNLTIIDPVSFIMKYGEDDEYLLSQKKFIPKEIKYEDIVSWLDIRGYLITEDFYKMFDCQAIESDDVIFSHSKAEKHLIKIKNLNNDQLKSLDKFLRDVKAVYSIKDNMITVNIILPYSTSL